MFYMNRIILNESISRILSIPHMNWNDLEEDLPMGDFVDRFTHWPGFLTSIVFKRDCFINGAEFDGVQYAGWGFLGRIYMGGRDMRVCVLNYPTVAQRLGLHSWKSEWPRYWLVNLPRMLSDLGDRGVGKNALDNWLSYEVSCRRVLIDAIVAKAFSINAFDGFWSDAARWQKAKNKSILILVRWLLPTFIARILYRLQPKYRDRLTKK